MVGRKPWNHRPVSAIGPSEWQNARGERYRSGDPPQYHVIGFFDVPSVPDVKRDCPAGHPIPAGQFHLTCPNNELHLRNGWLPKHRDQSARADPAPWRRCANPRYPVDDRVMVPSRSSCRRLLRRQQRRHSLPLLLTQVPASHYPAPFSAHLLYPKLSRWLCRHALVLRVNLLLPPTPQTPWGGRFPRAR